MARKKIANWGGGERGYILLLTLLISSITLAIGFGIYAVTVREVILATSIRDSERALAAAIKGSECALYWDRMPNLTKPPAAGVVYTIFATGTVGAILPPAKYKELTNLANAVCDLGAGDVSLSNVGLTSWTRAGTTDTEGKTFFRLNFTDGSCAEVTVFKKGNESTRVISDGYNTCNAGALRRIQREIYVFSNI